jgi:Uncharacterized relative of glutathione S-transferase, MAPEG superfamily
MPVITSLYAAILALLFYKLSMRTIQLRRQLRIPIGDGGEPQMIRAMRVHANFAEYVPLALVLLFLVESNGAQSWVVHVLGLILLAGRLLHAGGVSRVKEDFRLRIAGMRMTFIMLIAASVYLLVTVGLTWLGNPG